jgi:hypothetical protein
MMTQIVGQAGLVQQVNYGYGGYMLIIVDKVNKPTNMTGGHHLVTYCSEQQVTQNGLGEQHSNKMEYQNHNIHNCTINTHE